MPHIDLFYVQVLLSARLAQANERLHSVSKEYQHAVTHNRSDKPTLQSELLWKLGAETIRIKLSNTIYYFVYFTSFLLDFPFLFNIIFFWFWEPSTMKIINVSSFSSINV